MEKRTLHKLIGVLEDPIGTARPLWRDYSKHNGLVDFGIASLNGVQGMASRSTISWGYKDIRFDRNWVEAGRVSKQKFDETGLPFYRTSYHVYYPGQPVQRQADNWFRAHPLIDMIPRVLDLEWNPAGISTSQIADEVWKFSEIIEARDGVAPWNYSRANITDSWLASWSVEMLNKFKWWLAQYRFGKFIEHSGPPTRPRNVLEQNVVLHQTADLKPGFKGEVQNLSADWDRWEIGTEEDMHRWINDEYGSGEPDPDPDPDLIKRIGALEGKFDDHMEWVSTALNTIQSDIDNHRESPHGDSTPTRYIPTHKIVTTNAQGVKLRSWPDGSEILMIKNGQEVMFMDQTRSNNKAVVYKHNDFYYKGWVREMDFKRLD